MPGVFLALLLANLPRASAPGIVPWQNAKFLVVIDGLHLNVHDIKLLAKDRCYPVSVELESLKNKALINISPDNVLSMHTIIQETAWEFVREDSSDDPGNQSRLVDYDTYHVLKYNKVCISSI